MIYVKANNHNTAIKHWEVDTVRLIKLTAISTLPSIRCVPLSTEPIAGIQTGMVPVL